MRIMNKGLAATLLAASVPLGVGGVSPAGAAYGPGVGEEVSQHHAYVAIATNEGGLEVTDAQALQTVDAVLRRWEVESGGGLTFDRVGQVKHLVVSECDDGVARSEAKALFPNVKFGGTTGNHAIVIGNPACFGSSSATNGSGLADSGSSVAYSYTTGKGTQSLLHELGHNFGLHHAYADRCDAAGSCAPAKYKNQYSLMGTTMVADEPWVPAALDSFELDSLDLDTAAGLRTLTLEPGRRAKTVTVDLRGRGTDDGIRGVKVQDPTSASTYFLDFRNGVGRDEGAWYLSSTAKDAYFYNRGVTVEKVFTEDDYTLTSLQAFAQDDGTGYRYAKTAGEVFARGGVRVEVVAMELDNDPADVARLRITLTDPSVPLGDQAGELSIPQRAAIGSTLTATPSNWADDATLGEIRWFDDGVAIPGAVGATYTVAETLNGHRLTAQVLGTREGYRDRGVESNGVVIGKDLLTDGSVYEIRRTATDQLVTVPGDPTQSGTQVVVLGGAAGEAQRWTALANADGSYRLANVKTKRCLDDAGASLKAGSKIIEWRCHGGANQDWTLVGSGSGFALINKTSGLALTADADADGSGLAQQLGKQAWSFSPAV